MSQPIVKLKFAEVEWYDGGCFSRFQDGACYAAHPHDLPHYHALAHRVGYRGDILRYAREHEVAHHVVAEAFDRPSQVLYPLAHGEEPDGFQASAEEAFALALQRYARTNEQPFIAGMDWWGLRTRFLNLLDPIYGRD